MFKSQFCILALFGLAIVLAAFKKIGKFISESSGHPAHSHACKY
jgi:hypothetical protein